MKDESQRERLAPCSTSPRSAWSTATPCCRRSSRSRPTRSTCALGGEGRDRADAAHRRRWRTSDNGAGLDLPDHHRRLLRHARVGVGSRSRSAARSSKPTPIFTKLDPAIVDEELARLAELVRDGVPSRTAFGAATTAATAATSSSTRFAARCWRIWGVDSEWVPDRLGFDVTAYDGVWLVPGSPYAEDAAVLSALTVVRERGIPFLGTCGGMQYAVLEYVGLRARRARRLTPSRTVSPRTTSVTALACSLYGEERLVTPVPGTACSRRGCRSPSSGCTSAATRRRAQAADARRSGSSRRASPRRASRSAAVEPPSCRLLADSGFDDVEELRAPRDPLALPRPRARTAGRRRARRRARRT